MARRAPKGFNDKSRERVIKAFVKNGLTQKSEVKEGTKLVDPHNPQRSTTVPKHPKVPGFLQYRMCQQAGKERQHYLEIL